MSVLVHGLCGVGSLICSRIKKQKLSDIKTEMDINMDTKKTTSAGKLNATFLTQEQSSLFGLTGQFKKKKT